MKNIYTYCCALIFTFCAFNVWAQSPRMTVVEEATQASCPPCAVLNPILQEMLNANKDQAIFVGYQVDWPGIDPMNLDNPLEVRNRVEYYDMSAAPSIVIQGNSGPGPISTLEQSVIDDNYAETADFDIMLNASMDNDQLTINGEVKANTAVTGDLKLRLIITEKIIHNEDLAFLGTNGETEFHNVFKKFIGGNDGIDLADSWANGDTYTINEVFDLNDINIYNKAELEVVALVQNTSSKYIYQGARDSDIEITIDAQNSVSANAIKGLPNGTCSGSQEVTPIFKLENTGNLPLTSATINYNVNGGADQTYEWTGMLTTFRKEEITLPAIQYEALLENYVNVSVSSPNGVVDEDLTDNNLTSGRIIAPLNKELVVVEVLTDNYGAETYWEIRNEAEEVLLQGGNPAVGTHNFDTGMGPAPSHMDMYSGGTLYVESFVIQDNECYTFHITDYFGNGLSAPQGLPPYYLVSNIFGDTLVHGATEAFGEVIANFQGDLSSSIDEKISSNSIEFYPNPAQDVVQLEMELLESAQGDLQIINAMGQQVYGKDLGTVNQGVFKEQINIAKLTNGLYFVQLKLDEEILTQKLIVRK